MRTLAATLAVSALITGSLAAGCDSVTASVPIPVMEASTVDGSSVFLADSGTDAASDARDGAARTDGAADAGHDATVPVDAHREATVPVDAGHDALADAHPGLDSSHDAPADTHAASDSSHDGMCSGDACVKGTSDSGTGHGDAASHGG